MTVPANPKIYHIVHMDRLSSLIRDGCLWCDSEIVRRGTPGTAIGMDRIKQRRLYELKLACYPELYVGHCVPFYFCPRSVMLYLFYKNNHPDITYRGGQESILHIVADLKKAVKWANEHGKRWVFTDSNAGSRYFNAYADLSQLGRINWGAIMTASWADCREQKQAEFLMEYNFPWALVERIGVYSHAVYEEAVSILTSNGDQRQVEVRPDWYY